jgi:hypothetical protein
MKVFYEIGKKTNNITVTISYRIIKLFSEGLYSSPNKAVEELVCNSFDADAQNVHVLLSPDLLDPSATIVVVDDGDSMNYEDLGEHWIIGRGLKEEERITKRKRKRIGKFGIGKLATYVLANRLTHICKRDGKYYSASMDYTKIHSGESAGVFEKTREKETVTLPFRELTKNEAKLALKDWIHKEKKGRSAPKLFGANASKNWTVAIMSDLKDMSANLKIGRLEWVLATAMPMRDDFRLYLNGTAIQPLKYGKPSKRWIIGKDITERDVDKIGLDDLTVTEDNSLSKKSEKRFGLYSHSLGRITGYVQLYDDRLDTGKAAEFFRSNGFFIYAHERLLNEDDGHFGIGSNELSHGTFSRFRAVIHADQLDQELRSSRESVRECALVENFRNILRAIFNVARREWTKREEALSPGARFTKTIQATPYSLTQKPLFNLLNLAFKGKVTPRYLKYPQDLSNKEKAAYIKNLRYRIEKQEGLIQKTELSYLSQNERVAVFDIDSGILEINSSHPFVAHFLDEYEDIKKNLPLELLAMSEVLLEATLYQSEIENSMVASLLDARDELLRTLAKSTVKRNAFLVAQALNDAITNAEQLEVELVAAFDSLGFDAIPLGGKGKPDGTATAALGVDEKGKPQRYKVSLEAKSKQKEGAKVSSSTVGVSKIARHRDDYDCNHAIIVGPDFPSDDSALSREIKKDRDRSGKTITVMRVGDLARLVKLRPLKRVGPLEMRDLFKKCSMPDECKKWVENLAKERTKLPKYREILEVIWERQNKRPEESIEFGVVAVVLENRGINYKKSKIVEICKALEGMAPECISCRKNNTVELRQKPSIVLERIKTETSRYEDVEIKKSFLRDL